MSHLDGPITMDEVKKAISQLKNSKSPGANGIPAEAFKALNNDNLQIIHGYICDFWNGNSDYEEWHTGQGTSIPKTMNPDDPNKFRIINLMDVCSKIFSRILTARSYQILDKHGTKYQFGATPKVGCQDGNFTLKTLLHLRHQHDLESSVVFADLVKAFDTSNHALILAILKKFGAPPKFCSAIERLYSNLTVILKIGKEKAEINQGVGVRQGDNLSPVIFLLIMAAFSEILEAKWTQSNISKAKFHRGDLSDNALLNAQLTGHSTKLTSDSIPFEIINILYLDNGSFIFITRNDMVKGINIINDTFRDLGLEMHIGSGPTKSKTELMYFPTSSFFNHTASLLPSSNPNTTSLATQQNPESTHVDDDDDDEHALSATCTNRQSSTGKLTFSKMSQAQRETIYYNSELTRRIYLNDGTSYVDFVAHFKYLGTFISFDLTDNYDIDHRISKASQQMGQLKCFWDNPYTDLRTKHQIFLAIPANLLLWGCETWALRQSHINKLNAFWHRNIRRILKINIAQVRDDL
jgi:hypothetical protein